MYLIKDPALLAACIAYMRLLSSTALYALQMLNNKCMLPKHFHVQVMEEQHSFFFITEVIFCKRILFWKFMEYSSPKGAFHIAHIKRWQGMDIDSFKFMLYIKQNEHLVEISRSERVCYLDFRNFQKNVCYIYYTKL